MKRYINRVLGFTLIELMMVIAILAVLAMVAVPTGMRFLAKSKRAEAYVNLHSIYAAQKAYFAEHGKFSDVLNGSGGIGWQPEGYTGGGANEKFYYTYGIGSGHEGQNYFTGKLGAQATFLSQAFVDEKEFLILAAADIDGDGRLDILAVDHNNNIRILQDDIEM